MTAAAPPPFSLTVAPDQANTRLDRVLADARSDLSRGRVQALIAAGAVCVAGATVADPARRVKAGQSVTLQEPAAAPTTATPAQSQPLDIVYEDDSFVVVDKPAGLVVHPAPGHDGGTLVNALIAHCGGDWLGQGEARRNGIVHRLDKDTSGLLVAAKTPAAAANLTAQFADRTVARIYTAAVWGLPAAEGTFTGAIGRSPHDRKKMAVVATGGRSAETRYRVRQALAGGAAAVLACRLGTGRTHQIRVHMAEAGHPLIGDPVYGHRHGRRRRTLSPEARAAAAAFDRQALHAATLGFHHPDTGESLHFTSALPPDLAGLIAAFGGTVEKGDSLGHIQNCI